MKLPWHRLDPNERIGAPILVRRVGLLRAIVVGREVRRAARAGEPFAHLGPPENADDAASREQIGAAVLLYRALSDRVGKERAFEVTREAVLAAGVVFLEEQVGDIRRDVVARIPEAERAEWAAKKGEGFFNATMRWDEVAEDRVRFTVTACRFPPLCRAAGAPELAPIFCAVDEAYFGRAGSGVRLDRPQTIAGGGTICDFRLAFAPDDGAES